MPWLANPLCAGAIPAAASIYQHKPYGNYSLKENVLIIIQGETQARILPDPFVGTVV